METGSMTFVPNAGHDIFVSYGHGAPSDGIGGDPVSRWSQQFKTDLREEILARMGTKDCDLIDIWMDGQLTGHHPITERLRADVQGSALLLIIMSPQYLNSYWCKEELRWFTESPLSFRSSKDSVFVVRAISTDEAAWPEALRDPSLTVKVQRYS